MKRKTKIIIFAYGIVLLISFFIGPMIGTVQHDIVYNITCSNGSVEYFNQNTIKVCNQNNPLTIEKSDNYINLENIIISND